MPQFKLDSTFICHSPLTTVPFISKIMPHEVHQKGPDFGSQHQGLKVRISQPLPINFNMTPGIPPTLWKSFTEMD